MFERYVNFEFYKTQDGTPFGDEWFERYVNFEFYKTSDERVIEEDRLRDM